MTTDISKKMARTKRDPASLRQDADHPARLPIDWTLKNISPECKDCGWPVQLVGTRTDDGIVYVPRHGDPYGSAVEHPEAVWVPPSWASKIDVKRHIKACPLPSSKKKLSKERFSYVFRHPVCATCLDLLAIQAEQGGSDTKD